MQSNATSVNIKNDTLWKDSDGNPIKAQGGNIIKEGNTYHWFGANFAGGNDYHFYAINHYTSADLKNWKKETGGMITPGMPTIPFQTNDWVGRPYVLWNAATSKYVMVLERGGGGRNYYAFLTATSLSAENAWTYRSDKLIAQLPDASGTRYSLGDLGAYQDGNDAYLLYTFDKGATNGAQAILKLSSDFLSPLPPVPGNYSEFSGGTWNNGDYREAAAIFKYNSKFYYFTSNTNGWNSSETAYRTASSMAGPWSNRALVPTNPSSANSFNTQNDFILTVNGTQGTSYVYCGDRWSNYTGGDINKGLYAWFPITFDTAGTPTINGHLNWSIDTTTGTWNLETTTLLPNPGFENDLSSWTYAGNLWLATAKPEVHSGAKAVKHYSNNAYTTWLESGSVNISSGGSYTAKVWARSGGGFSQRLFQVFINGVKTHEIGLPVTPTWTEYSINNINLPAGATVKLGLWLNAYGGAWAQEDDFSLTKN